MSRVVSMRFQDAQIKRLQRLARRLGRTPSETSALLVEEALRQFEFGHIDFRDSSVGRQSYIRGSSLAVWEIVMLAQSYQMSVDKTAVHLGWPQFRVQAALSYAESFPEEIAAAIEDNDFYDFNTLSRMLPEAVRFEAQEEANP